MSETMKKKRPRTTAGGAGKHAAALHHPAKSKLDETIAAIEHMPRRLVHQQLRNYGIDPEKAVERLQATVDRLRTIRSSSPTDCAPPRSPKPR
jgi:hypothetical protein